MSMSTEGECGKTPRAYKRFSFERKVAIVRKYLNQGHSYMTMCDFIHKENQSILKEEDKLEYGAFTYWVKNAAIMTEASRVQTQLQTLKQKRFENNLDLLVHAALGEARPNKKPRRYFTLKYKAGLVRAYLMEDKKDNRRIESIVRNANPGISAPELTLHCKAFKEWLADEEVVKASQSSSLTSPPIATTNNPFTFDYKVYLVRKHLNNKRSIESLLWEANQRINQNNKQAKLVQSDFRDWMTDKDIMVEALKSPPEEVYHSVGRKIPAAPKTYSFQFKVSTVRKYLLVSSFMSIKKFVQEENSGMVGDGLHITYGALSRWLKDPAIRAATTTMTTTTTEPNSSVKNEDGASDDNPTMVVADHVVSSTNDAAQQVQQPTSFSFDYKVNLVAKYLNGGIYQNLESVVDAANVRHTNNGETKVVNPGAVQAWLKDKDIMAAALQISATGKQEAHQVGPNEVFSRSSL